MPPPPWRSTPPGSLASAGREKSFMKLPQGGLVAVKVKSRHRVAQTQPGVLDVLGSDLNLRLHEHGKAALGHHHDRLGPLRPCPEPARGDRRGRVQRGVRRVHGDRGLFESLSSGRLLARFAALRTARDELPQVEVSASKQRDLERTSEPVRNDEHLERCASHVSGSVPRDGKLATAGAELEAGSSAGDAGLTVRAVRPRAPRCTRRPWPRRYSVRA